MTLIFALATILRIMTTLLEKFQSCSLIFARIFALKDEIEAGNLLLNLRIVAPANLIKVLLLDVAKNDAFSELSLT